MPEPCGPGTGGGVDDFSNQGAAALEPAVVSHVVQAAAARYNWNRVLMRRQQGDWRIPSWTANPSWCFPHYLPLPILARGFTLLQGTVLVQ